MAVWLTHGECDAALVKEAHYAGLPAFLLFPTFLITSYFFLLFPEKLLLFLL